MFDLTLDDNLPKKIIIRNTFLSPDQSATNTNYEINLPGICDGFTIYNAGGNLTAIYISGIAKKYVFSNYRQITSTQQCTLRDLSNPGIVLTSAILYVSFEFYY